jgi:hypothetical protein
MTHHTYELMYYENTPVHPFAQIKHHCFFPSDGRSKLGSFC